MFYLVYFGTISHFTIFSHSKFHFFFQMVVKMEERTTYIPWWCEIFSVSILGLFYIMYLLQQISAILIVKCALCLLGGMEKFQGSAWKLIFLEEVLSEKFPKLLPDLSLQCREKCFFLSVWWKDNSRCLIPWEASF